MGIGLRIKELRKEKKLSQKALSEQIKVDSSQFSKIEQEKSHPTIKQLMELSSIFEKSLDWLITGKEYEIQQKPLTGVAEELTKYGNEFLEYKLSSMQNELLIKDKLIASYEQQLNIQGISKQNAG